MNVNSEPTVFVLLPVHNRREITRKFVSCLVEQTYQHLRLIVIDDGSTDGTAELVQQMLPEVRILTGDGRWWWGGCMQQGYQWLENNEPATEDMVLLANDDIVFDADFIARAVKTLRETPNALLGAQLRNAKSGAAQESGVHADLRRFVFRIAEAPGQINCLPTRALMLRWADMRRTGGFHPRLLPHYWADYEYTIRAHRLGLRCFTTPDVAITADLDTTGYRDLDALVGWGFVRQLFSIKTPLNPLYRTSFAILASSGAWKLVNAFNVWIRAGFRIVWQGVLRQQFPGKAESRTLS
jgi:GT2 family glycosyltransferase